MCNRQNATSGLVARLVTRAQLVHPNNINEKGLVQVTHTPNGGDESVPEHPRTSSRARLPDLRNLHEGWRRRFLQQAGIHLGCGPLTKLPDGIL